MRKEKPADTTLKPSPDWMKNNSAPLAGDEIAGTMICTIHNNTESEIVNIIEPKKWTKTQTSSLSDQYCTAMKNTNIRRAQNVVFEPWCLSSRVTGVLMMFRQGFIMVCTMVLTR
jgi:hypothetical protein